MTLHSRYINGNLAFWDTHQCRIIDAFGATVTKWLEHFITLVRDDTTRNPLNFLWFSDTATDSCVLLDAVSDGVLQLITGGGDNNATGLQLGSIAEIHQAPFVIAGAAGVANSKPVYFGIRVKCEEHVDEGVFVGLAEPNCAVDSFLADDSGVVADKDFVGFNILTATPEAWNITWKKNGQLVQTTAGAAVNADDWHTFEFYYDGGTKVTFWIDGTAHATQATTTAATFPGAEKLAPIFYIKTGEAAAKKLDIDWCRVVQFN